MAVFEGRYLRKLRESLCLTQKDVSDYLKCKPLHVSILEASVSDYGSIYDEALYKFFFPNKGYADSLEVNTNSAPSPIYGFIYPDKMLLCAPRQNVKSPQPSETDIAHHAAFVGTKKSTRKNTLTLSSATTLSVGDISSQCLSNTGSASYRRLLTWLEEV